MTWDGNVAPVVELVQTLIASSGGAFDRVDVLGHSYGQSRTVAFR